MTELFTSLGFIDGHVICKDGYGGIIYYFGFIAGHVICKDGHDGIVYYLGCSHRWSCHLKRRTGEIVYLQMLLLQMIILFVWTDMAELFTCRCCHLSTWVDGTR